MSDPSNREARREALAQAKAKLEARKKARQSLKAAREERQRTQGNTNNFGRQYVENFMKIIAETEKAQEKQQQARVGSTSKTEESKDNQSQPQSKLSSKYRAPGRRRILESSDYTVYTFKDERTVEMYDKEIGTDPMVFDQYLVDILSNEFDEKTMQDPKKKDKIYAEFIKAEEVKAWPPSRTHSRSMSIGAGLLKALAADIPADEKADWENYDVEDEVEEVMLMEYEDANYLINSGNFLDSFRLKSKWMERALGINEENALMDSMSLFKMEDISFDMSETIEKSGGPVTADEIRTKMRNLENQKKYSKDLLKLKTKFVNGRVEGRPIGWIEFSNINPDWFLATYSRRDVDSSFSSDPEGCINIWNFCLPRNPEYTLYADSMVSTARFHPTQNSIIFGATLSGQILQWDIRTNNYSKPVTRTNFAHGHSSPVFGMQFLPSMNAKNQHFVSVSNDGKVCMWRDNDLQESTSEIILRVDEADKQALLLMGGGGASAATSSSSRSFELGTTCFSYSIKEWNTMTFGSDEGNIYKAEIHGGGKANDDSKNSKSKNSNKNSKSQQVKKAGDAASSEYVNVLEMIDKAHEGPITNISYNPCQTKSANTIQKQQTYNDNISTLYLTSSFDWTVKLWHSKYHTRGPISIFDNMTDYVYDVKWSNVKPSVFACGDGNGLINMFNLNEDFGSPIGHVKLDNSNETNVKAVTRLEFTKNGKYLMAGDSDGTIHMYSLHKNLYTNEHDEYDTLADKVQNKVKGFDAKE